MRAIEAIGGGRLIRWIWGWTERQVEIAFGAGLILFVAAGLFVGEVLARAHDAFRAPPTGFDWFALMDSMEPTDGEGPPRFAPGSSFGTVHINNLGYRGPDIAPDKPEQTIRIALLGDSKLLNAEVPDDDMIGAQLTAMLAQAAPLCRYEHVTVAGPAYTMDDVTELVQTQVAALDPDLYIILLGSMRDILYVHGETAGDGDYLARYPWFARHSRLAGKLYRAFHLARQEREAQGKGPLPDEELAVIAAALQEPSTRLAGALGEVPVVAVGYRGQLREAQSPAEQQSYTRHLRLETRGLGSGDLARLNTQLATELETASDRLGWTYIDPIADIAPVAANFADSSHLSPAAIAPFAASLAEAALPLLEAARPDCVSITGE